VRSTVISVLYARIAGRIAVGERTNGPCLKGMHRDGRDGDVLDSVMDIWLS
jgi:hypothetical protein